jgi:hypothetical protein
MIDYRHVLTSSCPRFQSDPYLQYRPEFARSLPVQILLTGIVLTLVSVLLVHLFFTAQCHWPLAPLNFILQLSGVISLLIMLFANLHVVLAASIRESQEWPYMLSYIAVRVQDESLVSRVTWSVMCAWTAGLIQASCPNCFPVDRTDWFVQITHIQFLTLLYPSRLEAALIFGLLGEQFHLVKLQVVSHYSSASINNLLSHATSPHFHQ